MILAFFKPKLLIRYLKLIVWYHMKLILEFISGSDEKPTKGSLAFYFRFKASNLTLTNKVLID